MSNTSRKIRIAAFKTPDDTNITEETIELLAGAGVDIGLFLIDTLGDRRDEVFDMFQRHGMQAIHYDTNILSAMNIAPDKTARSFDPQKADHILPYLNHPALLGSTFLDEPGYLYFEAIGRSVKEYTERFPGKMPYINLLPMYANNLQLAGGATVDRIEHYETPPESQDYQQYIDSYVRLVPTDYICVDIYPHMVSGTYSNYVRNIEIVAEACRKSGREFWIWIQTCSWRPSVRIPNEVDFRWQIYTMLAFGAMCIQYFVFSNDHEPRENQDDVVKIQGALTDYDGTPLSLWYASRKITTELRLLSPIYTEYYYTGAFTMNVSEKTPYLEMANPLKGFDAIADIDCAEPLLVGCFQKDKITDKAVMLVNMTDPGAHAYTIQARMRFTGKAVSYFGGRPLALTADSDGFCSIILPPGEGVFITVG